MGKALKIVNLEFYIAFAICLISRQYLDYFSLLYLIVFWLWLILNFQYDKELKVSKQTIVLALAVVMLLILIATMSKYSISNTIISGIFLVVVYIFFNSPCNFWPSRVYFKFDCFYYVICIGLSVILINAYINGKVDGIYFTLESSWDKNYSGVVIFLFFCYCDKKKYIVGKIIAFLYAAVLGSRALLIALAFLYLIKVFKKLKKLRFVNSFITRIAAFNTKRIFYLFIISTLFMLGISYVWISYISNGQVSEYQQSINDKSNAIRTRSNLYAIHLLLSEKNLIVYGYDNDIKSVLGVEDTVVTYKGYRLVQPHNVVLNLFLKNGIIFGTLYLIILSKLLAKWWTEDNLTYIFPYFFLTLVMHSLLSTSYLVFFMFVLAVPKQIGSRYKIKSLGGI